jgi:Domain of unknown function (DUF4376)
MYQYLDNGRVMHVPSGRELLPTDAEVVQWMDAGRHPAPSQSAAIRGEIWERIKEHRDALKSSGVKVGADWFHSDADSRIQQLGLVMMGAGLPAGLLWKTMSGSFVKMTPALAGQIFQATAARDAAVFGAAEKHRAALTASQNPAGYDWTTGWPEAYEGAL